MGIYSEKLDLQFFSDTHEQHILTSIEIKIFFLDLQKHLGGV